MENLHGTSLDVLQMVTQKGNKLGLFGEEQLNLLVCGFFFFSNKGRFCELSCGLPL